MELLECYEKNIECNLSHVAHNSFHSSYSPDIMESDETADASDDSDNDSTYISFFDNLTHEEMAEAEELVHHYFDEYYDEFGIEQSHPDFMHEMNSLIAKELYYDWSEIGICDSSNTGEILDWVEAQSQLYMNMMDIPPRQGSYECHVPETFDSKMSYLRSCPQHAQKSPEWYAMRENCITASSVWKIFASEAQRNSLIFEKCNGQKQYGNSLGTANMQNSLQWGNKYEPVSRDLYALRTNTEVEEFGLIIHPKYSFLGASPDGVVAGEPTVPPAPPSLNLLTHTYKTDNKGGGHRGNRRFPYMVEIKNIVNREITGEPLEAYWIQMQIQLEVCDLEVCDFVETRFLEFEYANDYYEYDGTKGIILHYIPDIEFNSNDSFESQQLEAEYVYMPLQYQSYSQKQVAEWIDSIVKPGLKLYYTYYWRLDQYSVVEVWRNRVWFEHAIDEIQETWEIIEKERKQGYEHRAPAKKKTTGGASQSLLDMFANIIKIDSEQT